MDWLLILAYLGAVVALLLILAALLYVICYFTNPTDKDNSMASGLPAKQIVKPKIDKHKLTAAGGQTMLSTLQKAAKDSDVVVATAISSIPLRELGGKHSDIVVDVSQQMYLDKDMKGSQDDEHRCLACSKSKYIAWNQVSCYAQTTIGVLVYKRAHAAGQKSPLEPNKSSGWDSLLPRSPRRQRKDSPPAVYNKRLRSMSTSALAPAPDSRLGAKSPLKVKSIKSSKSIANRSPAKSPAKSPSKSPGKLPTKSPSSR